MFWSSRPVGRPILATRCCVMKTAFTTIASVMAICNATRMAPARLRSNAERMGRISISLRLQIGGGRRAPDAPGWVEPGDDAGPDRDGDHDQQVRCVERQHFRRFL